MFSSSTSTSSASSIPKEDDSKDTSTSPSWVKAERVTGCARIENNSEEKKKDGWCMFGDEEEQGQELKVRSSFSLLAASKEDSLESSSSDSESSSNSMLDGSLQFQHVAKDESKDTASPSESQIAILGRRYDGFDHASRRSEESALLWFTYRRDFAEVAPYGLTTDAGWGCMLRASQMLLAQTLRMHLAGRDWRPPPTIKTQRKDLFLQNVMAWFADAAGADCPFSIHNMIACGLRYEKLPGEWYGPSTACYVLRDLCQIYKAKTTSNSQKKLKVAVAQEGCVYKDTLHNLMTQPTSQPQHTDQHILHPLHTNQTSPPTPQWDAALLLLVPLRLGLKSFNPTYSKILAHTFTLPQSLGFIGGRPRHALYFYGCKNASTNQLFGLDPHTVQQAPQRNPHRYNAMQLTDEYMESLLFPEPTIMNIEKIDPSLALAFYCTDFTDFQRLADTLDRLHSTINGPQLFTILDAAPDYTSNVSLMNEMMMSTFDDEAEDVHNDDADDDYVFL